MSQGEFEWEESEQEVECLEPAAAVKGIIEEKMATR